MYEIKNFRIFMSGESYAGRYVPYISAAMLDQNDTEHFDVSGKSKFYTPPDEKTGFESRFSFMI